MRAITLWQPWASQIFDPVEPKDVENRSTLRAPEALWETVWAPPNPPRPGVININTGQRPFFAIHAGLRYDLAPGMLARGAEVDGWPFPAGVRVPERSECPLGAVIGVVRLRHGWDSRTHTTFGVDDPPAGTFDAQAMPLSRWWLGPIGWRLKDAIKLSEPVPCRGMLGCWTLPPDVEALVRVQLAAHEQRERERVAREMARGEER